MNFPKSLLRKNQRITDESMIANRFMRRTAQPLHSLSTGWGKNKLEETADELLKTLKELPIGGTVEQ